MKTRSRSDLLEAIKQHFNEDVAKAYAALKAQRAQEHSSAPSQSEAIRFTSTPDSGDLDLDKLVYQ